MSEIQDWEVAAANNNDAAPDGWPEGMNYSQVNDSAREGMAVIARWYKDTNGTLTTAGTGNAYTIASPNRTISAYAAGQSFVFKADRANTGNVTLNINGLGANAVLDNDGNQLAADEIAAGGVYFVVYDGTQFQLIGSHKPFDYDTELGSAFPVGAVYFTAGNTNPGTFLPGTWTQRAEGRFIVGVGQGTDANAVNRTYPAGNDTVGEYEHTLTDGEMPSHRHTQGVPASSDLGGSSTMTLNGWQTTGSNRRSSQYGSPSLTNEYPYTSTEGNDEAHENSPPGFGLYVWERTA